MIRELLAQCPDRATEIVIADWCEENGRDKLAASLRSENDFIRARAIDHLASTLDGETTVASFLTALRYFEVIDRHSPWMKIAENLISGHEREYLPNTFFAPEHELEANGELRSVRWMLARELVREEHRVDPRYEGRLCAANALPHSECPVCGKPAILVGEDDSRLDGAGDPYWTSRVFALCSYEPHLTKLAESSEGYESVSR